MSDPKYLQIAAHVAQAIECGSLLAGQRVPSVRALAQQFAVSHNTALEAFRWLEDAQLIQARPRSGFFVCRSHKGAVALEPPTSGPQRLSDPQNVSLDWYAQRVLGSKGLEGVITFGTSAPDEALLDQVRLRQAVARVMAAAPLTLGSYPSHGGLRELRQVLARYAMGLGCRLDPDSIVLTHGCLEGVVSCLQAVTRPGDIVAIESPAHFSVLGLLQNLGLRALEIPTHVQTGISLDALQLALDSHPIKAVLVVPTIQNPLSACMPVAHRKRLAELASAHEVPVIEDAIYYDWSPHDAHRRSIQSFDQTGHVMLCHAFTKTLAPGLRVGWLHAGRWGQQVLDAREASLGTPATMLQLALLHLLGQNGHAAQMRRLRQQMAQRLREARGLIARHFPKGTRLSDPPGGLILWLQLPDAVDGPQFEQACEAQRLLAPPGRFFSLTGRFENCYRIALGNWSDAHRQALVRMGRLAGQCLLRGS
ncbi:PLP-dependent aminotransferase family protein [Corticibacter populi]|uniref:PLP-dependent aminotransferase family protein n=1 Tax=Corticibacter populi TaxID=1550736 RepID=A0A3M6QRF8_9BURK|nr:PLP-dependent aminotransferase family protein [Corticibacter populi]RMX05638.1 PLP-dependent aminotransferase family protein [Corticibacter populi]RZS31087.1 DNA-binding transcriptional MocR family regulator [Corticibacter populi]